MERLIHINTYGARTPKETTTGLLYADYINVETGESWYEFADDADSWEGKGLYIVSDKSGYVIQSELDASMLSPDDASVWLLEGATERLSEMQGSEWRVRNGYLVTELLVGPFSKDAAILKANTMIGIYEDLNDKHAEADWRNYRIKAFNWAEGDETPKAPVK